MPSMSFKKPFRAIPIHEGARYAAGRRKRRQKAFVTKVAVGTFFIGAVGTGSFLMRGHDEPTTADQIQSVEAEPFVPPRMMSAAELDAQQPSGSSYAPAETRPPQVSSANWSYRNCREARAAGAAPLYAGQPGYGAHMDGDGDGIACEPYRGQH